MVQLQGKGHNSKSTFLEWCPFLTKYFNKQWSLTERWYRIRCSCFIPLFSVLPVAFAVLYLFRYGYLDPSLQVFQVFKCCWVFLNGTLPYWSYLLFEPFVSRVISVKMQYYIFKLLISSHWYMLTMSNFNTCNVHADIL